MKIDPTAKQPKSEESRDCNVGRPRIIVTGVLSNFAGQGWLLLISFATTPYILNGLSLEVYGIYALAGVVMSYLGLLEFGMGTAVTRYASRHLADAAIEQEVAVFWAGFAWVTIGGFVAVLAVAAFAPWVAIALNVPPPLRITAIAVFRIATLSLCCTLNAAVTAGMLRAMGQFTLLNRISVVTGTIQAGLCVSVVALGRPLAEMMWSIVFCQAGMAVWQLCACLQLRPGLRIFPSRIPLKAMLSYGGVLTVDGIFGLILTHVEKLLLVRLTSVRALSYYTVPFMLVDRIGMIPSAFGSVLFPSLSYYSAKNPRRAHDLCLRGTRYICVGFGFCAALFVFLGRPMLDVWMGPDFGRRAAAALAVLALGGLLNAAARPAIVALQGMGKPHIPVRLHIAETIGYLPLAYVLTKAYGIDGAAWAWCVRAAVDAVLLHVASACALRAGSSGYRELLASIFVPLSVCSAALAVLRWSAATVGTAVALVLVFGTGIGYAVLLWFRVLDADTKEEIAALLPKRSGEIPHA
jgi:O-antigen/teichoic acid export membrane protein